MGHREIFGLKAAELNEIRRQDPARAKTVAERRQIEEYRQAVREASEGKLGESFDRLDKQSAIIVCSPFDQQDRLAESYLDLTVRTLGCRCFANVVGDSQGQ